MKPGTKRRLKATLKGLLTYLDKETDWMLIPSKRETIRRLWNRPSTSLSEEIRKAYYESTVRDGIGKLLRKGHVEIKETGEGTQVRLTQKGKTEVLRYRLGEMVLMRPTVWDGKWRVVMFDVAEMERVRRDELRRWLVRLGLKRMQGSVWVYPYPFENEIRYLRELLGVPHGVKLITADKIENDEELRELFDV